MARHLSFEEKMTIVEYYLKHGDLKQTTRKFEVAPATIKKWALIYHEAGPESLKVKRHHHTYTMDFKERVFMCAILDLFDNSIVAYRLGLSNNNRLVFDILEAALTANPGDITHDSQ